MTTIAIRCDVDFSHSLKKGVPFLAREFKKRGIKVTYFVAMGPDGFGYNLKRVKNKDYQARLKILSPPKIIQKFGVPYIAARLMRIESSVGSKYPKILTFLKNEGHELGIHGWNHYWWAENAWSASASELEDDILCAKASFKEIVGEDPKSFAAPNWRISNAYLKMVDGLGFSYLADVRGSSPFYPYFQDWKSTTLQVPFNLPCLHEVASFLSTKNKSTILDFFEHSIQPSFNVWCIHDYYEGLLERELFLFVLDNLIKKGFNFVTVGDLATSFSKSEKRFSEVVKKKVPGGRGEISSQKEIFDDV